MALYKLSTTANVARFTYSEVQKSCGGNPENCPVYACPFHNARLNICELNLCDDSLTVIIKPDKEEKQKCY